MTRAMGPMQGVTIGGKEFLTQTVGTGVRYSHHDGFLVVLPVQILISGNEGLSVQSFLKFFYFLDLSSD